MIDLDIDAREPASKPDESLAWITSLLVGAGIDVLDITGDIELHARNAQHWHSWIWYWESSRAQDGCSAECKDDESFYRKLNWAKKQLCHHLKKIGLTDPDFCGLDAVDDTVSISAFHTTVTLF